MHEGESRLTRGGGRDEAPQASAIELLDLAATPADRAARWSTATSASAYAELREQVARLAGGLAAPRRSAAATPSRS